MKNKLPGTNIQITPIAFGAWAIGGWFWGGTDEKESVKAIEHSIDIGITTIDTAPVYGFGLSEELVGKAIKGKRDKVQILTKFGLTWTKGKGSIHFKNTKLNDGTPIDIYRCGSKEQVIAECEECLTRLGTDYIELFQQHWPDPSTPVEETMEAIEILKQQGKIDAGGVSNYSVEQMKEASKFAQLSTNQMPYSMVLRDIEKDLVPWSIENNVGIIAYSPLQRGILTGKIKAGHKFGEGDHRPDTPFFQEPNLSLINNFLNSIKPIAESHKVTLAQLVLRWTIQQPGITCVLAGSRTPKQIEENAVAMQFELSKTEIATINTKLAELKLKV
ncbi:MAG: aldo/keto reductase [Mariniphaga sp.]|nr:aldo/keto reductase [Mariniphaga sp.]